MSVDATQCFLTGKITADTTAGNEVNVPVTKPGYVRKIQLVSAAAHTGDTISLKLLPDGTNYAAGQSTWTVAGSAEGLVKFRDLYVWADEFIQVQHNNGDPAAATDFYFTITMEV